MSNIWILYQTTNNMNGKIYIGVHKLANTSKSKNYLGSGLVLKTAIKKYGRKNFVRATLAEFSYGEDAYTAEENMVNREFVSREDTYNIRRTSPYIGLDDSTHGGECSMWNSRIKRCHLE